MGKVSRLCVVAKQRLTDVDMPDTVTLSLADLARSAKEHLLSLSVAAGLMILKELLEAELTRLVGPTASTAPSAPRTATAWSAAPSPSADAWSRSSAPGPAPAQGRRSACPPTRPSPPATLLSEAALARMLAGISRRQYEADLEPIGDDVKVSGTGRSAVSRRFIAGTRAKLAQLRSRDLGELGIVALFTCGIEIAEHTVVVALGVDERGGKHVLGLAEGTTENAATCTALLSELIERRLPTDRAVLFVIDGGKAIRRAIRDAYGALAPVQRCRFHKRQNAMDQLPEGLRPVIGKKLDQAWATEDPDEAERSLRHLASSLEEAHQGGHRLHP